MDNNTTLSICHPVDMQLPLMFQGQGQDKQVPDSRDLHQLFSHNLYSKNKKKMVFARAIGQRVHYLSIISPVIILGTFIITYCISASRGHVELVFPYISYTAVHAPSSGIFGQLVNMGALLMAFVIYIRYLQMAKDLSLIEATWTYKTVNKVSLGVGWVSAFGFSMVANFETVKMRPLHYTGAGLAFFLGVAYVWLQTSLSLRYRRWTWVAIAQLTSSIVTTVGMIVLMSSKTIYKLYEYHYLETRDDVLQEVYLTSTISQWLTAFSMVLYIVTFYRDFARIELNQPTVTVRDRLVVMKDYNIEALQEPEDE
ncbi:hypothetical protein RRG08_048027 [Elysia crispata]|uniref:CWH43-like N-terminal domain-containing protein n=1 Tax=Elysia crispata TaxID=231223 RepID=A0AAE0XS47_9GAST|nr:hypothetical protein RRG08_048027 [Elysia crispata]